jgi:uncharacterized iron-regulated membrane protein
MASRENRARQTRGRLYAMLWRWHFLASLLVIPFVLWQSTTGTLCLWSEWWMDVSRPDLRFVEPSAARAPLRAQVAAALASSLPAPAATVAPSGHTHGAISDSSAPAAGRGNGIAVDSIIVADDALRSTTVLLRSSSGLPYPVFVNPHDGRVLGILAPSEWLPGLSRSLHGGWPLGRAGSWLLELTASWAIVMIMTGLYLWWPHGRSLRQALWPRFNAGARILLRDLHACVAVLFSAVFLFFLISALPWTAFWGEQVLPRVQMALGQESPAGSPGGASVTQIAAASTSLDEAVATARARGVKGILEIRLAPWPGAPWFMTNRTASLADDRTVLGDTRSGAIVGDFRHDDHPLIPRLVAVGIHVHQGDFGPVNLWLNTAFALSLVWLSVTGVASWWNRRPKQALGVPPKVRVRWPRPLVAIVATMCLLLPIFAASILTVAGIEKLARGFWNDPEG